MISHKNWIEGLLIGFTKANLRTTKYKYVFMIKNYLRIVEFLWSQYLDGSEIGNLRILPVIFWKDRNLSDPASRIFSCFPIAIKFRRILTINGITNNIAALDNVENGVTGFSENVAIGAITANAINANASAPPNNPILQIKITKGAIINEIPMLSKLGNKSEFKKTSKNPTPPNPIQ